MMMKYAKEDFCFSLDNHKFREHIVCNYEKVRPPTTAKHTEDLVMHNLGMQNYFNSYFLFSF